MRALTASALLGSWLTGCMAPPEAEDLLLVDEEHEPMLELLAIPYGEHVEVSEPVVAPTEETPEPEPASPRTSSRPRFAADAGPDACWGMTAEGFPAISDDGTTIVVPQVDHLQLSGTPGTMSLEWHDVASGVVDRALTVVPTEEGFVESDDEEEACARVARGNRRRAHAANAALADERWRVMERLPVAFEGGWLPEEDRTDYLVDVPPRDRVVQIVARHGEVALRIPGVKVLERHPLLSGEPYAVYGDRATSTVVLVTMACIGDSCTCDPSFRAHVLHWSPETFAAIDHRPCVVDGEDDEGDGWTSCEPMEYEFDVAPWALA